jgi:inhibitor of KinA
VTEARARYSPFGEAALLVTLGDRIDIDLNRRAHLLATAIGHLRGEDSRLGQPVTGYSSVLLPFDPLELDVAAAEAIVAPSVEAALAADPTSHGSARLVTIETRYGGEAGPDLDEVAEMHGLRPADVIELHSGSTYLVFMLGFAPGFGYLGPLPAELVTPRRATPRERVPAGSVAIAGEQTAVYPFATPGGWRLIGRTERRMWDLGQRSPALLRPGDSVRFEPAR